MIEKGPTPDALHGCAAFGVCLVILAVVGALSAATETARAEFYARALERHGIGVVSPTPLILAHDHESTPCGIALGRSCPSAEPGETVIQLGDGLDGYPPMRFRLSPSAHAEFMEKVNAFVDSPELAKWRESKRQK